ncbi:Glutamate--cysteine ligase, partial [Spiromyces aspiralis]
YTEMSIDEIINGRNGGFVGLIPIVLRYLDSVEADGITRTKLMRYIKLISLRASGALMTNAAWIRNFVRNHPKYKGNSVVTSEINYDLMQAIKDITNGVSRVPELFGELC